MTSDTETTFTRRKFTITEYLDDVLVTMADKHYQGNVSLALRAAIGDHRMTLEDPGKQRSIGRILTQLERIADKQKQLDETVSTLVEHQAQEGDQETTRKNPYYDGLDEREMLVYEMLHSSDEPVRLQDLRESVYLSLEDLQYAVGTLLDLGLITRTENHPPRFLLVGTAGTGQQNNE